MSELILNLQRLNHIVMMAQYDIKSSKQIKSLETLRIKYLGKNSFITVNLKELSNIDYNQRPIVGKYINLIKNEILLLIKRQLSLISDFLIHLSLICETVDVS